MKKLSKLKISSLGIAAFLGATAIALPIVKLCNKEVNNTIATRNSSIGASDESSIHPTNIPNKRIFFHNNTFYYEYRFITDDNHKDWGVFADLCLIHGDLPAYIRIEDNIRLHLQLPATIDQAGGNYKVRGIGYGGHNVCDGNYVYVDLDLQSAEWLDTIGKKAFCRGRSNESNSLPPPVGFEELSNIKVRSINWRGAKRLRIVDNDAFAHQYFHSNHFPNFDMSGCQQLQIIGDDAFYQACADNKNVFESIIFPPSLKRVGDDAFSTGNEACRCKFKKVVFTDNNPPDDLFMDGIPRVADKNSKGIVVPFGCGQKYINLKHFDRTYKDCVRESTIWLDPTWQKSSTKISSIVGRAGADKYHWKAMDQETGLEVSNVKWWLSDNLNGNLSIDKDGLVSWKNTIPAGVHKFRVYCSRYDDKEHKTMSVDVSDEITISVFKSELTGGSTYLNVVPGVAGQDTRKWIATVDQTPGVSQKTEFKPKVEILNLPEDLIGHVTAERSDDRKTITIKWDDQIPATAKSCTIDLKAEVQNECDNSYFLYKNIYLDLDSTIQKKINVLVSKDGGEAKPYTGDLIEIGENEKLSFTLRAPTGATDPELAIENIKPKKETDAEGVKYTFDFNTEAFKATVGKYQFYAHSTLTESGITYDVYTPTINININGCCAEADLNRVPDAIQVTKEAEGNMSFKLIDDDKNSIITNVFAVPASWDGKDTRLANQQLVVDIDEGDNKSIAVSWTNEYSKTEDKIDLLDIMLEIHVYDPAYKKNTVLHKALTIQAINSAEVNYLGEESVIQVYPGAKVYSPAPFEFKVNSGTTTPSSVTLECYAQDEEGAEAETSEILNKYISMYNANDNTAYLVCDLKNATAEEQKKLLGMHNILVYGYDEYNICLGYTTIPLKNSNEIEILDAPESLDLISGKAGTDTTQLWTSFNGTVIENPVYTLESELGSHIWVNENNFIQWDDKLPQGYYDVILYSKHVVTEGVEEYTAARHIEVRVILPPVPEPTKNVAAIVGGTAGGLVVAGGAAAGIAVGVNKHKKAKKTK